MGGKAGFNNGGGAVASKNGAGVASNMVDGSSFNNGGGAAVAVASQKMELVCKSRASSIVDGAGLINGRGAAVEVQKGAGVQKQGIKHVRLIRGCWLY